MHCFRDAPSLLQFLHSCPSAELYRLICEQLEALAVFDDVPLSDLVTFFILETGDSVGTLELALGRHLADIPVETCLSHSGWFELIIIVSDDGFGYAVFIPKDIADPSLLDFCVSQSTQTLEDGS